MSYGHIKLHRSLYQNSLFKSDKFCRGFAWIWMISRAAFKDTTYDVRGKTIHIKRGQFIASPQEISEVFGWSRSAVNRFLTRLKTEHMIEQSTEHGKTLITICNYTHFQGEVSESGQLSGQASGHKSDTNRTTKEESKERKENIGDDKPSQKSTNSDDGKPKRNIITFKAFPDWISQEHAKGILEHRRAKKQTVTEFWFKRFVQKLEQVKKRGGNPNEAIELIIDRGWQGFEADWFFNSKNEGQGNPSPTKQATPFIDRLIAQGKIPAEGAIQ